MPFAESIVERIALTDYEFQDVGFIRVVLDPTVAGVARGDKVVGIDKRAIRGALASFVQPLDFASAIASAIETVLVE